MGFPLIRLGVPPCGRAYFLLLRQKKVAKEKATPGYAVGVADSPALLEGPGGCATRGYAPQTVLADCPRPFSVARRSTWGPRTASWLDRFSSFPHRRESRLPKGSRRRGNDAAGGSARIGLPGPLERRRATQALAEKGRGLSEGRSPEFRSPRQHRVAQGTGRSPAPTQGWPFLWLLSFGHTKESTPAPPARNPQVQQTKTE